MRKNLIPILISFLLLNCSQNTDTQNTDDKENDNIIHNTAFDSGEQKDISIEFVRQLGDLESADENYSFYMPSDFILDKEGNIYITDEGNYRIQKFDRDGNFIAGYGKQGQGPNEFSAMNAIAIDDAGNLYISDHMKNRIVALSSAGKEFKRYEADKLYGPIETLKSGNFIKPSYNYEGDLISIISREGKKVSGFGEIKQFREKELTQASRNASITKDIDENIYIAYQTRNLIEKYSSEGNLLLQFDREINFNETEEFKMKKYNINGQEFQFPEINNISAGIAVADNGRIWVATYTRQLNESEMSVVSSMSVTDRGGGNTQLIEKKLHSNSDLAKTDIYLLEVFDAAGSLLTQIPIDCYCNKIKIFGDRLFILDTRKGMCVYEYRIIEK
ncbi:NHL repeat-containing protein [candidate division KSB1 bacterium]